jgi:hypothetical protein
MRSTLGLVGLTASLVVVAIAGRQGFAASDTLLDGIMWAFFYGLLALGAIGGPAAAVHLGKRAPVWGVLAGLFVCIVIVGNISVTFGAMVGRIDRVLAERMQASQASKFDAAELRRAQREREGMAFTRATADDVKAAQAAVDAAELARKAECDKRGQHCRAREVSEQAARDTLTSTLRNKAETDRAAQLDKEIAAVRARVGSAQAVTSVNPQAEALARVLSIDPVTAATYQPLVIVVLVEMLTAFALLAWELLRPRVVENKEPAEPAGVVTVIEAQRPPPPAPKLLESDAAIVARFMLKCLPRAEGEQAMRGAVYKRFLRWCDDQSPRMAPLNAPTFWQHFEPLCERVGVKLVTRQGKVYALGVKLAA